MSELLKIDSDLCSVPEYRIKRHSVARARLRQPRPYYAVGDVDFDNMVMRLNAHIMHGHLPGSTSSTAYIELRFGTSLARVFAAGPLLPDGTITVVEV